MANRRKPLPPGWKRTGSQRFAKSQMGYLLVVRRTSSGSRSGYELSIFHSGQRLSATQNATAAQAMERGDVFLHGEAVN